MVNITTAYHYFNIRNINQSASTNPHEELCFRSPYYRNIMVTIFIVVIGLSVLLNILLWIAFISKKRLRTVVLGYLISLSLSDVITAGSLGWMEVVYIFDYPHWWFGEIGNYVINAFWCFSLVTPFTHVVFIAYDRYRAVTSSVLYSEGKSWRRELLKISMLWIYSIGIVLLYAFYFNPAPGYIYQWNVLPEWYYPFVAVHLILPLVMCTVLYVMMMRHVTRHRQTSQQSLGDHPSLTAYRFARSVGIIITFLYVVWIPVIVMESLYATHAHTCIISQLGPVSVWLTCTSGVINPVVLLVKDNDVRHAVCCRRSRGKMTTVGDTVLANMNTIR